MGKLWCNKTNMKSIEGKNHEKIQMWDTISHYLINLIHQHIWAHTYCIRNLPFMRSTRYSWLGVMSRYWTMEFIVGMDEAFITAACFRLLMLASGGRNNSSIVIAFIIIILFTTHIISLNGLPPIWSSGQPILLSWLLTESISLTRGTKMVSLIHCKKHKFHI